MRIKQLLTFLGMGIFTVNGAFAANSLTWDKTFPKSDKVEHQKVSYYNRLGINIVADMYLPKKLDKSKTHPAIVVGTPFGAVKEQAGGFYAQNMAERGFVTLAFDASYNGESGGQPRNIASADVFVEDFSAGVDFIGTRPFVDKNRIGAIGVCGSGGFVLSAAAVDSRIKAITTISMYDMGRDRRQGLGDMMSKEDKMKMLDAVAKQRWVEFQGGERKFVIGTPESIDENSPDVAKEFFDYYRTRRGQHPRSLTAMSFTSNFSLANFFPFAQIDTISPRPILFVAGENANSRYFSEDAYKLAKEPKQLYIVPKATHVDLYDKPDYIPFDKLQLFFNQYLK